MPDILKVARSIQGHTIKQEAVACLLTGLKRHHRESYEHSLRVGLASIHLGLIFEVTDMETLSYAAHLHDVGKTEVDVRILRKNGTMTEAERQHIQGHVRSGYRLLRGQLPAASAVIARHHEFQLQPYPRAAERRQQRRNTDRRQANAEQLLMAQIIAICDMADALYWHRAYKESMTAVLVEQHLRLEFTGPAELIKPAIGLLATV